MKRGAFRATFSFTSSTKMSLLFRDPSYLVSFNVAPHARLMLRPSDGHSRYFHYKLFTFNRNMNISVTLLLLQMESGKTKQPTLLRLPTSSNGIMRCWLKFMRPVLVKEATHEYIFVHKNGSAPRIGFSAQIQSLQMAYLGRSASTHAFRGMQVSAFLR